MHSTFNEGLGGQLLEISGLGVRTVTRPYTPTGGAGTTPMKPMVEEFAVGKAPLRLEIRHGRGAAYPVLAYNNAMRFLRMGRFVAAQIWARRAYSYGNIRMKRKAVGLLKQIEKKGMAGLI